MPTAKHTCVLLTFALLISAGTARAEAVVFKHEATIYQDAKEGALKSPEGVACSDGGLVVVADTGRGRLVTYTVKDGTVGGGTEVKLPQLSYPVRVQLDSKGNIVALDGKTHRIVRLDGKGAFAGYLDIKGASPGATAMPVSVKLDASDNVYVLDVASDKVLVLDPTGSITRQLELPKDGSVFTDIGVDAAGTIFAVDGVGASVWSAEKGAASFKALTKSMKDRMSFPEYIAATKGKLFLVDQFGNGIVLLGQDGSYLGRQLSIGWNDGLVYYPSQLCITGSGEAFVADRGNNRVQLFTTMQ